MRIIQDDKPRTLYHYYPDMPQNKGYTDKYLGILYGYYGNNWFSLDPLWSYDFSFLLDTEYNVFWVSVTKGYKFAF